MKSWEKQILSHVNRDVNIYHDNKLVVEEARIINIDLNNMVIVFRLNKGEGVQGFVTGGSIRIEDIMNYKPGYSEYNRMNQPENFGY